MVRESGCKPEGPGFNSLPGHFSTVKKCSTPKPVKVMDCFISIIRLALWGMLIADWNTANKIGEKHALVATDRR